MYAKDLLNRATILDTNTLEKLMIEYAKYHVAEALMSAKKCYQLILENEEDETTCILPNKSYRLNDTHKVVVDEISIITAYDLDNIG